MLDNLADQTIVNAPRRLHVGPSERSRRAYVIGKRVIDVTIVLLGGAVFLPLILMLALLVKMDGGPAFYLQPRIGQHGRVFRLWKLRSMVPNADKALHAYLELHPAEKAEWNSHQKLRHDPRLTRYGALLRRYSLDELPQLWNVLAGDMSLVGPRPMMPEQRLLYEGTAYFDLRPGLTGLWQISCRNESCFADRALYDERYGSCISPGIDFAVLFKTVGVVFRGTGY